jgi:hypothetical protein
MAAGRIAREHSGGWMLIYPLGDCGLGVDERKILKQVLEKNQHDGID